MALEYHTAAYPLEELVNVLLSWGTHQISFGQSNILFAASNRELTRSLA